MPVVSILTIVRNGQDALPDTIGSVIAQTYPNIEYVIVDGGSTDGTLDVVRRFEGAIDRWLSEPDRGTSDAINKAISLARGEFISWLGAGDWFDPGFISAAVDRLVESRADYVYGDLQIYREDAHVELVKGDVDPGTAATAGAARFAVPARVTRTSPTMVIRRACFERIGLFNLRYKIRNDFDWILRLHLSGGRGCYDSRLVAHFRLGGLSDVGGDFTHIRENLRILARHGLLTPAVAAPYLYTIVRYSVGHAAQRMLPATLHRALRRILGRHDGP